MKKTPIAIALLSTSLASPLMAQDIDNSSGGARLEEVLVTAQFREESMQDVPIAISAVSGEGLTNAAVRSMDELSIVVPGITIKRQTGASLVFLRGVGTGGGQAAQEGAVATFIDGVYQPSPSSTTMSLSNLARVEVLKGPQGTLYGRNATGGAINVVTLAPSTETNVRGQVGYGNKDTVEANFYGTTGIGGNSAIDLAAYYRDQGDGFGENLLTGSDINMGEDLTLRSKLLLSLTERTELTLAADYNSYDGSEGIPQRVTPGAVLVDGVEKFPGDFYDATLNVDPDIEFDGWGVSATLVHQFNDSLELTSITAYRELDVDTVTDPDGSQAQFQDAYLYETNTQFTQEIRLAGDAERFNWLVGLYYLEGESGYDPFYVEGIGVGIATGGADIINIDGSLQDTTSMAAFGQLTYAITDSTNVTGGVRYTKDKREYGAHFFVGLSGLPQLGLIEAAPANAFDDSETYSEPTWRLAVDHLFSDNIRGYMSYNRGFKSGIYNVTAPGQTPVDPELLDAYEIGIKSELADGRIRLNGAAFYYEYDNIQLTALVGAEQQLLNAAEAEISGLEVDFNAAVTESLTMTGGLSYTDGEYVDFPNAPTWTQNPFPPGGNSVSTGDGEGNTTVFTPEYTANLALDYVVAVGASEIAANISYVWTDSFYFTADNSSEQDAYGLVNAQLTWFSPDRKYNVRLWGRNVADEEYYMSGYQSQTGATVVAASGRTYGISVGFDY